MKFLKKTLDELGMDFLLSRDHQGGNILHRLFQVRRKQSRLQSINVYEFIIPALEICPFLICQTDSSGDTPLHVLEKCRTNIFLEFRRIDQNGMFLDPEINKDEELTVNMFNNYFKKAQEMAGTEEFYHPPWRVKNEKGNTPLHEAVLATDIDMVRELLNLEKELAGYVNNSDETPLHLLSKSNFNSVLWTRENETIIINKSHSAVYMRDKDGLTPFLRAARDGNLRLLELLGVHHPQVGIRDYSGKTFWHLLADRAAIKDQYHDLLEAPVMQLLDVERNDSKQFQTLYLADNDGNTPLHLAIKNNHFKLAQLFLEYPVPRPEILYTPNMKGVKPRDLIAAAQHLPADVSSYVVVAACMHFLVIHSYYIIAVPLSVDRHLILFSLRFTV
ncbi:hypothetical protein BVRB_2g025320 [Beta vulgaris subsp. vulgaris]|nr:hypothetical protein BVRB_2g025320 [Beta vulgaris subsp. vulgaris]